MDLVLSTINTAVNRTHTSGNDSALIPKFYTVEEQPAAEVKILRVGIAQPLEPFIMPCSVNSFDVRDGCEKPGAC